MGFQAIIVFVLNFIILSLTFDTNQSDGAIAFDGNKDRRRSILNENGQVLVDCVDIMAQPTLQHPSFKNHTIQMSPSSLPKGLISDSVHLQKEPPHRKFEMVRCKPGTIPIIRTKRGTKSVSKYFANNNDPRLMHLLGRQSSGWATSYRLQVAMLRAASSKYYGAHTLNMWYDIPNVSTNQLSGSLVFIANGPIEALNVIAVGWMVNPEQYGDNKSRLFGFWTADGENKTGCFDMKCAGFVQVSRTIHFGGTDERIGKEDVGLNTLIHQDPETGNWWLTLSEGGKEESIGYWPKSLFNSLASYGSMIEWGGFAYSSPNISSPVMGKGVFPLGLFEGVHGNKSFQCRLQIVDESQTLRDVKISSPPSGTVVTSPSCYGATYYGFQGDIYRKVLSYGGPGGPNC